MSFRMIIPPSYVVLALVAWGTAGSRAAAAQDLPGEGTLPGEPVVASSLPPESVLPEESAAVVRTVARTVPEAPRVRPSSPTEGQPQPGRPVLPPPPPPAAGGASRPPPAANAVLPSEAELPLVDESTIAAPARAIDPLVDGELPSELLLPDGTVAQVEPPAPPIGKQPAGQPWLRFNMDGHTSTVRALTFTRDASHLCSGGDDKGLEVWGQLSVAGAPPRWVHERTVRWQVHRGARGRIHALSAGEGLVAMAGHGAMGMLGEILLIDPATGALRRVLANEKLGNRQTVVSLSLTRRATHLASQDITGRAVLWKPEADTGIWRPQELALSDEQRYGPAKARRLVPQRGSAPIVTLGERFVVLPVYHEHRPATGRPDGLPTWNLERIDLASGRRDILEGALHGGRVTALAASADGNRMASADTFGNLFVWNMAGGAQPKAIKQDIAALSLAFSDDGRTLAVGGGGSPRRNGSAAVQLWDTTNPAEPRRLADVNVPHHVYAVALDPQAKTVAYTQNQGVVTKSPAALAAAGQVLEGRAEPVLRVAFARGEPRYRIAFGTQRGTDGRVVLDRSFNLSSVRLESLPELRDADWLTYTTPPGNWNLLTIPTADGDTYWLAQGERRVARLPLRPELHGNPTATCWIAARDGSPFAVAVGTALQGNIFVFRVESAPEARLFRQFRGHEAGVRSISMSSDRRYLVSASDDATIRVWNLEGFDTAADLVNRWGMELAVVDGELTITAAREDGPVYFRGLRAGDVIESLKWMEGAEVQSSTEPAAMLKLLRTAGPDLQVAFEYRRRDAAQPPLQLLPAWQQLAALYVARNREWAMWTPAGYYDASFEGHKLFGWQVNRSLQLLPEFFLAAQFQQALERPDVMDRLLDAGSLEGAFRAARQPPPGNAQNVVPDQYRLKPRVEILAPAPDVLVSGTRTRVEARITVRDGLELTPPKAFANGVVASGRRLLGTEEVAGGRAYRFAWDAALPSDPRIVIQVVASTDGEVVDTQSVVVRQVAAPRRAARMYIVAAGVNQYRDAQIQRLDFAASNARSLVETLRGQTAKLYASEATMLVDDQVTRPMWGVVTGAYAERLREEARPDDLLVFFLSGHGVRDEGTSRYYFVAANARYDDVKAQRFSDCLSFEDFAAFAEVPCRKLVVLDTCHSGAVQQPLRQQDLKAALRALQTDVVFTLTASDGSQEAAEEKGRRLGRFTSRLLEALSGAADKGLAGGNGDGVVTLQEAFQFVSSTVAADSAGNATVQHPTAGPIDLLDFAILPLAGG